MRVIDETIEAIERLGGALVEGEVTAVEAGGRVRVAFEGDGGSPVTARLLDAAAAALAHDPRLPAAVLLLLPRREKALPIVVGLIRERVDTGRGIPEGKGAGAERELTLNGRRLVLEAGDEIVLRCGRSTIEMRADGKIVIKGTHLLSRSAGMNRIKGGAVSIN